MKNTKNSRFIQLLLCMLLNALLGHASLGSNKVTYGGGTPTTPTYLPQMYHWAMFPNSLDFLPGSTPPITTSVSSLPSAMSSLPSGTLCVSAHDDNNAPLFYVTYSSSNGSANNALRDAFGNPVATLPFYRSNAYPNAPNFMFPLLRPEMAVVPVPGECRKFYVFYMQYSGSLLSLPSGTLDKIALLRVTIDCSLSTPAFTSPNPTLINETTNAGSLAVSKLTNGTRTLFFVAEGVVAAYSINGTGVSLLATNTLNPNSNFDRITECDLSPDGTKLAFSIVSGVTSSVKVMDVNQATGIVSNVISFALSNNYNGTYGVEFSSDSKKLYYSNQSGISVLNLQTSITSVVSGASTCRYSMIELGHDGFIYAAGGSNGGLFTIDQTNDVATASTLTISAPYFSDPSNGQYVFPDQIDGEDYSHFFGLPRVSLSPPILLNSVLLLHNSFRVFCSTSALSLGITASNATLYRLTISEANASGAPIAPIYTGGWVATLPTNIAPLISSPAPSGLYYVSVEAKNQCPEIQLSYGLFRLENIPPPNATLVWSHPSSILCSCLASQDPNNPNPLIGQSVGIELSNGPGGVADNGYFTFLNASIDEYVSPGSFINICNVGTAIQPGFTYGEFNLNELIANSCSSLGPDYFVGSNNSGRVYRVTLTLANTCGADTQYGYFTPMDNARPAKKAEASVALFPNPVQTDNATLSYNLSQNQKVSLRIIDAITGQEVLTPVNEEWQSSGHHVFNFNIFTLHKGSYIYQLVTDKVVTGRFVKQ